MDNNMKQTPIDKRITARMQPGNLTYNGFLGTDRRDFRQIIADDEMALDKLGKTAEEIADRLEYFQNQSYDSFQGPAIVDKIYEVETEVVRGFLPCPFGHNGIYRKSFTTVKNTITGKSFTFTALNIHLIREHHFFEGKDSHFRLEPHEIVAELF
nr:hypothetical protein [Candidatus Cloacimonadota bacterium]